MASRRKGTRVRTLHDLERDFEGSGGGNDDSGSNRKSKPQNKEPKIATIPNLHDEDRAKELMKRICKEFVPILQRRGYNVVSISELCCCGDGLDHLPTSRRKRKKAALNILGYNQTYSRGYYKRHTIHLRLREPHSHVLKCYEEVAGTMSHELAHCEVGPHNIKFYKLMDEIQEQHAVFMAKGIVADNQGFPVGSDQAHVLGGSAGSQGGSAHLRKKAAQAAQRRREKSKWMPQGPQKLGGSSCEIAKWLTPSEAAAQAAEARRKADEIWCQPCETVVIELSDDEEESDDDDDRKVPARPANNDRDRAPGTTIGCPIAVDCTSSDDEIVKTKRSPRRAAGLAPSDTIDMTSDAIIIPSRRVKVRRRNEESSSWACRGCTLRNNLCALACGVCGTPRLDETMSLAAARDLYQQEKKAEKETMIKLVTQQEVAESKRQFGGFNIYGGSDRQPTRQMNHIT